ncbi:MAG: serine/threonine-protein kinase, partial [Gemmataceae bacterium]
HPNLVRILDFGKEHGSWFAVMELIDGTSLEGYLAKHGRPTVAQARRLFASVADGLAVVHGRGVVHRDIKPSNVVLRQDGSPVLVDFGVAGSDAAGLTRAGHAAGYTALFASPEQLRGRPVDVRSDVYSLAATLYYALTYDGDQRRGKAADDFEPDDVPGEVREVLRQGLSPRAARRHSGAADFRTHLDVTGAVVVPPVARVAAPASGNLLELPLEDGCGFGRWSLWLDGRDLFALYRDADTPLCREGKDLPELQRMTDEMIRVPLGFNGWWEYRTPRTEAGKVHTVYSPGHLEVCYLNYLLYRCLNDPRAPRHEMPAGHYKAERWRCLVEATRLVLAYEPEGLQIVLERDNPHWYAPGYKLRDRG